MPRSNSARGRLILHGVKLEPHEKATVDYFLNLGKDIEIVVPSNTPKRKSADLFMDGVEWEMKSPETPAKKAIENLFYNASSKAQNVIMDLRRLPDDGLARETLDKRFSGSRKMRKMLIITKNGSLIKYQK